MDSSICDDWGEGSGLELHDCNGHQRGENYYHYHYILREAWPLNSGLPLVFSQEIQQFFWTDRQTCQLHIVQDKNSPALGLQQILTLISFPSSLTVVAEAELLSSQIIKKTIFSFQALFLLFLLISQESSNQNFNKETKKRQSESTSETHQKLQKCYWY